MGAAGASRSRRSSNPSALSSLSSSSTRRANRLCCRSSRAVRTRSIRFARRASLPRIALLPPSPQPFARPPPAPRPPKRPPRVVPPSALRFAKPTAARRCRRRAAPQPIANVGLLFSATAGAMALSNLWLPLLADKYGRKAALIVSLVGSTIGYLGQVSAARSHCSSSTNIWFAYSQLGHLRPVPQRASSSSPLSCALSSFVIH